MPYLIFFGAIFAIIIAEEVVRRSPKKRGIYGALRWKVKFGTLTLIGNGPMEDYSTGSRAPWGCGIKSVVIGEGITRIGEYAFAGARKMKTITVPGNIRSIGSYAFAYCTGLDEIIIEGRKENVSIGHGAFPEGVTVTFTGSV